MASYHVRSNSLPSRPHAVISEFDEKLCRLRASEATSSSVSTSLSCKLSGLQDLLDCVNRLLLLPLNQQALSREKHKKWVDQILDGDLRLLDVCNIAKDALLQIKKSTQELQSVFQRRRCSATDLSNEGNETTAIVSMLREVQVITQAAFKLLLSFIYESKSQSKSFISNIMRSNRIGEESQLNEFSRVEAALKKSDNLQIENAQNQLEELELCIQDLEEGLQSLFRRLIKTRVSLLNTFNH
ncbi:hypothetical protein FNV43_RR21917 [Rhamnella rubrinervis]|uniref:Uncharacterized protein n=1 Tax=Rhamnella rubrinervis TaxID=2594499 RepID=A0A8K0GUN7_9ROSA|nr:hypothetical protein FNV43_RR21917 [Rhamnella rubrinervis]